MSCALVASKLQAFDVDVDAVLLDFTILLGALETLIPSFLGVALADPSSLSIGVLLLMALREVDAGDTDEDDGDGDDSTSSTG